MGFNSAFKGLNKSSLLSDYTKYLYIRDFENFIITIKRTNKR
jgi:hypothetical protein